LGIPPEEALGDVPLPEVDAFRNMKARALRLIDQLAAFDEPRAGRILDEATEFLRRMSQAERSAPSPEARTAAAKPVFDERIRAEYRNLFDSCVIRPQYKSAVQQDTDRMLRNQSRYEEIQGETNVPWYVVGVVHNLEASFNFAGHLHNGDDIRFKTRNVPRGRPPSWDPPKSSTDWRRSAEDALAYDSLADQKEWDLEQLLYRLEGYNGWGPRQVYRMNSPYLWSFSVHYNRGKYESDGHWNPTLVSDQCGAGVLIKALVDAGSISRPANWRDSRPLMQFLP
jgi:lysozyme family protein